MDFSGLELFLLALLPLVLTVIIETPIAYLFFRKNKKAKYNVKIAALANGITNLSLNLLLIMYIILFNGDNYVSKLEYSGLVFLGEVLIAIIPEYVIYWKCIPDISKKRKALATLICNIISFLIGMTISLLLYIPYFEIC